MSININEKIFEFAYSAGLHDAINQKAYIGVKKELIKCDSAKETIRNYISAIIKGTKFNFYETAEYLASEFNNFIKNKNLTGQFTFGNAQKLINITVKYMYITVYANPDLRDRFKDCHCPLDNKIGTKIKKRIIDELINNKTSLPGDIKEIIDDNYWKSWDNGWSKINNKSYSEFQAIVKYFSNNDGIYPIEYDYINWP